MRDRRAAVMDGVRYEPGRRFRVIIKGLRLVGFTPERGGYRGWDQELQPGDIITCTGYGPGWGGDPGYGIEFTSEASEAAHAVNCDVSPHAGGVFNYRPPAGSLEPEDGQP